MPDSYDRDDQFKKDPTREELYPRPESDPDEVEIISPSLVTIEWPSFDLQANDFGETATPAFLEYMLRRGPKSFTSKLSLERTGYFTCDYTIRVASKGDFTDVWDYHGPMEVEVESTFRDAPLQRVPEGLEGPLTECFRQGGYVETSEGMQPFEEYLSPLKLSMVHRLVGFTTEPWRMPVKGGKFAGLKLADFQKAVMAAKPQVFIYWRGM